MAVNGHTNGLPEDSSNGLKIIIVGAGIGGLSAAISLRAQGHDVEVSLIRSHT